MFSFASITAIWTAVKGIPLYIIGALLAVVAAGYLYYSAQNANLRASLATTQKDLALSLQSNKSLEADNQKRQKEFEAAEKERLGIQKNDETLISQARKAREDAESFANESDKVRQTNPEEFIKEINRQAGCSFEGFGNPSTCDTISSSKPEDKK